MKAFMEKIKKALKNNYWLQPVLLIVLVFAMVFGLQAIPGFVSTIKGWFTQQEGGCPNCTVSTFDNANSKIQKDDEVYVLITQTTCVNCTKAYPIVNKFLGSYKNYSVLIVDIQKNSDDYIDSTITDEKLYSFGQLIDVGITSSGNDSIYNSGSDEYVFLTPTLMHFEKGVATEALVGIGSYEELLEFMGEN